jgi:hypothetical protein
MFRRVALLAPRCEDGSVMARGWIVLGLVVACREPAGSTNSATEAPAASESVSASAPSPSVAAPLPTPTLSAPAPSTPPTNVTSPAIRQRCLEAARACAKSLLAGDYDKIIACMPNQALVLAGGREAAMSDMIKGRAQMNRDGVSFDRADVDPPHDLVQSGGQTFALLPQRVTMKVPAGKLVQEGFLVGVSFDDGVTWKFVDGASLTQKNIHRVFPSFPSTIVLPVVHEPHRAP